MTNDVEALAAHLQHRPIAFIYMDSFADLVPADDETALIDAVLEHADK